MDDDNELKVRIDRGVLFLDETVPNWREQIDMTSLELDAPSHCVLGQVFGSWGTGTCAVYEFEADSELLDPDSDDVTYTAYGFEHDTYAGISYEDLQDAWERVIAGGEL